MSLLLPTALQVILDTDHLLGRGVKEVVLQKEVLVREVPPLLAKVEVFLVAVEVENYWDYQTAFHSNHCLVN